QPAKLAAIARRQGADELVDVTRMERQELADERAALLRQPHAEDAPVRRLGSSLDDAVTLGAIDEPGHVARRDEERAAQPRERLPVLAVQAREQIEPRERDPILE